MAALSGELNLLRQGFDSSPVGTVGAILLAFTVAWALNDVFYNLVRSSLSRFPGPKLWAVSRIPSQLSVLRGHTHLDITALHERYGPIVRIGPNELAFCSAQAFQDIYNARPGQDSFPKDRKHYVLPPNGVDHLVSAVDTSTHVRQRRLLAHAFSERALKEQEGMVRKYVDLLISKLREQIRNTVANQDAKVDIKSWLNYTTFDITGDLMFGEPFGCLRDSELHPWIALIFNSIKAISIMGVVNQFPLLNSVLMSLIPKSVMQQGLDHFNNGAKKVDNRLELGSERPDFISAMLKNGLSEKKGQYDANEKFMTRDELHSNAFIVIIAGSETSATLLSGCLFYLCNYPKVMERLLNEIRSNFTSDDDITFSKTAKLPYLAAVIEESLRIYPPFVTSLARTPPVGGGIVDGQWIPADTIVACHHYASYHTSLNFSSPNTFIPERWISDDTSFKSDHKDVLQPFSLGPRGCLGKPLAYAEIRLILCKLLFNFDIELSPESKAWINQDVYFLWDKPPLIVVLKEREM